MSESARFFRLASMREPSLVDAYAAIRRAHAEGFTLLVEDGFLRARSWPQRELPQDLRQSLLENLAQVARVLRGNIDG